MSLTAELEVAEEVEDEASDEGEPPGNAAVELAVEAAEAFEQLEGCQLTRMARLASTCAPRSALLQLLTIRCALAASAWQQQRVFVQKSSSMHYNTATSIDSS